MTISSSYKKLSSGVVMNEDLDQLEAYKVRRAHLRNLNKSKDAIQGLNDRVSAIERSIADILQRLDKWQ